MGWKGTARKVERKIFGKGGAKRRYGIGKGKGGFKIAKLAADLEMVKNRLNVEKKYKDTDVTSSAIGQVNANVDGVLSLDVTPTISQGVGRDARVGNSLKLTGMTFPMSFTQQIACMGDRKVRVSLIRVRSADNGVTATEALQSLYDINPLNGLRDYNAPRAYRNSKTDGITVLRTKTYHVKGPDVGTPGNNVDTERNPLTTRFSVKLQDILRYAGGGDTSPDGIRYFLIFQCNAGNLNTSVGSTTDVPIQNVATGLVLRLTRRDWWVDN